MIYEFALPCIVDTKNINSTFTKKKFVPKEFIPRIKRISKQRKGVKQTLKHLAMLRAEEVPPFNLIEEITTYGDGVVELNSLFERDYPISKNWKWTPILTQTKILKFSQSIKYGKSGEIIMARYAGFSACFRNARPEISFVKQNLLHKNNLDLYDEMTFSAMMKKDPMVTKLEEAIYKSLKAHVKAWIVLKKYYDSSKIFFNNLANYPENYIEAKPAGMEITLLVTKINTNMLYIEYLRLQGNYEEMGKYAKMIVTQAFLVENLIKSHGFLVDPKLNDFVLICQKLYKAISLWSLFFTYLPKLKTDTYHDGEDINTLAGGCCSFVEHISQLHRDIVAYPPVKSSFLYGTVCFYFKDILVPKSLEVAKTYSEVFKGFAYDDYHFDKMDELDYVSRTTGEGHY
jgi:hypothetical protein